MQRSKEMPNVKNLKPVVKMTKNQFKEVLNRVLNSRGELRPASLQPEVLGEEVSGRMLGVPRPESFERFPAPQQIPISDSFSQMPLPTIPQEPFSVPIPPVNMRQTVPKVGQMVPPVESDLIPMVNKNINYGPSPVDELLSGVTPIDKVMGRYYSVGENAERIPHDLPWEEARKLVLENPSKYIPENSPNIRPVTKISQLPRFASGGVQDLPYSIKKDISVEKMRWSPIQSDTERRKNAIKAGLESAKVEPKKEEVNTLGKVFSDMWRLTGGGRTEEGKRWEYLRQTRASHPAYKNVKSGKDYFLMSAASWSKNPQSYAKSFPQETKMLTNTWDKYMKGITGEKNAQKHILRKQTSSASGTSE